MESNQVFLVRHAQSTYNQAAAHYEATGKKNFIWDLKWREEFIDCELSQKGVDQAVANIPQAHSLPVSKVFVSPLKRALQTAQILFKDHPNCPSIVVTPLLYEKLKNAPDVSLYEGTPFLEYSQMDWSQMGPGYPLLDLVCNAYTQPLKEVPISRLPKVLLQTMIDMAPDKIESAEQIYKRTQATKAIWRKEAKTGNIALVSHSNFFKFFLKNEDGTYKWLDNCEIYPWSDIN